MEQCICLNKTKGIRCANPAKQPPDSPLYCGVHFGKTCLIPPAPAPVPVPSPVTVPVSAQVPSSTVTVMASATSSGPKLVFKKRSQSPSPASSASSGPKLVFKKRPSASPSPSLSPNASLSASASASLSASASASPSASLRPSPNLSLSASTSPSPNLSLSASTSPSPSPNLSLSAKSSKLGKIYIQSKVPPRQSGDLYPGDKCGARSKIDVTSGQKIGHPDRVAFSPMTEVPDGYMGFYCFENFWQSGKRYKELGHMNLGTKLDDIKRWKAYSEPHRRHPKAKGMVPVDAIYPDIGITEGIDYVTSRKQVYVPYYYNEIISKDRFQYWRSQIAAGNDILIVDYDGPKVPHGNYYSRPCLEVTLDLLVEKINDTRYPFGHGYVVAAALLGIDPDQYTS
jgi:hypothetical protein